MISILNDDVLAFLKAIYKRNVKYILVGGLAVNYYGYSRTTGDVDIWLEESTSNREKLVAALTDYGIDGADIFKNLPLMAGYSEIMLDSGVYIDLMAGLAYFKQADFASCYEQCNDWLPENDLQVKVLHINQLVQEKEHNNRLKDQDDLMHLKRISKGLK